MSFDRTCPTCAAPLPEDGICPTCTGAATVITPPPGAPGLQTIGDFEIIDKLGQGGMGAVYRARQISLGRMVALKVLPNQFGDDPEFISRFQREAKVAASLSHANLVRVFTAGQADGCHFIAMELIDGENLHQRMRRERLAIPEALRICANVARGLQCGWQRAQLVHRDIKPSNIYLSHSGEVKVGDLGLAKSLTGNSTGLTQTGTMMGTPHYMSPEQIRGDKALDFRADIYSLGCTLYELLTGQPPYPGSDPISIAHQHINAPLPAILRVLPGCPMPLVRLVGRMLKKNVRERHASYEDLIAELDWVREQIESGTAVTTAHARATSAPTPATPRTPTQPAASAPRRPPVVPITIAVVLVLGIGTWALLPGKKRTVSKNAAAPTPTPQAQKAGAAKSPPAAPQRSASAGWQPLLSTADEPWTDGLAEWLAVPGNAAKGTLIREGTAWRFKGPESISLGARLTPPRILADVAVRQTVRLEGKAATTITLRGQPKTGGNFYSATMWANGVAQVSVTKENQATILAKYQPPAGFDPSDRHVVEFRARGDMLTLLVDGQERGHVQDATFASGGFSVAGGLIEKIEYRNLAAASPATSALPTAATGWQPLLPREAKWRSADGSDFHEFKDGLLQIHNTEPSGAQPSTDGAIRARIRFLEGTKNLVLFLRSVGGVGRYLVGFNPTAVELWRGSLRQGSTERSEILGKFPLPKPLAVGDTLDLELRAQGPRLTVLVNGTTVIEAEDTQLTAPGKWGAYASDGWLESLEVQPLPADSAAKLAPSTSSGERWTDALAEFWKQKPDGGGVLVQEDGGARVLSDTIPIGLGKHRDIAVRATVTGRTGFSWKTQLRWNKPGNGDVSLYRVELSKGKNSGITLVRGESTTLLAGLDLPPGFSFADRHTMEVSILGDTIACSIDGRPAATVKDATLSDAGLAMFIGSPGELLEKLEYR